MKKLIIIAVIGMLMLTACSGSNVPSGADAKAWNAGNKSLQYLDEWEEHGNLPNDEGIAAKIMRQADSLNMTTDFFLKDNKTEKEQYRLDMYNLLFAIAGFKKGKSYTGVIFDISEDGQRGTQEDYEHYYELKSKLVDLLQIDYTEDYTLLTKGSD